MEKKKVLIVTQEMEPFTELNELAEIARKLPEYVQGKGMEIRVLMPKYGVINERRHRLHEVVRLSGMNIIVDDDDFPLIIKVASIPKARVQVYFLDNEDFFKRKFLYEDEAGKPFEDNPDRMIFFCKGVIETVKKFGWPPDVVHCHGWMTSLIPAYLRNAYKTEALFQNSKIVYSVYDHNAADNLYAENFLTKASINDMEEEDLLPYQNGSGINLHKGAAAFSDGIIYNNGAVNKKTLKDMEIEKDMPMLDYKDIEDVCPAYVAFYDQLVAEVEQ